VNNNLTPEQTEALTILMEECGELIQACSKILRFGPESRGRLATDWIPEAGDVLFWVDVNAQLLGVGRYHLKSAVQEKEERVRVPGRLQNIDLDRLRKPSTLVDL
jgi:NTP pyrophosphatase (non-canonical NTP hydrolase)